MLKHCYDLNFPWEQQHYIKIYKGLLALGQLRNSLRYIFITKNYHTILSLVYSDNRHNSGEWYDLY